MKKLSKLISRVVMMFAVILGIMCTETLEVQAASGNAGNNDIKGVQSAGYVGYENSNFAGYFVCDEEDYGGLKHTLINVHLTDLISDEPEAGFTEYKLDDGQSVYFLSNLSQKIDALRAISQQTNMSLSVVFLVPANQIAGKEFLADADAYELRDSNPRGVASLYYAPNADESTYGGKAIKAFWSHFVQQLNANNYRVDNFILGNEVNMPNHYHYSGSTDVNVVAAKYANVFYDMYEAVKYQYSRDARCSVSIDHSWNWNDMGLGIPARDFLDSFHSHLTAMYGNVDWYVSAHLYPSRLNRANMWENDEFAYLTSQDVNSYFVDGTNLHVMTNYIRDTFGSQHRVMLTEQGFTNAQGAEVQAAALAYSYYAAMYDPMVDSFILNTETTAQAGMDFALTPLAAEVYTKLGNGNAADEQRIADVCLPVIGVSSWSEIIPNYGINNNGNGWSLENGYWYYYQNGVKATGWVNDGGTWYYMNSSGTMTTGWVNDGGTWYYMSSDGTMTTGWVNDGGTWYYMNPSGTMATGWVNDGGVWYYMDASGAWVA